LLNLLIEGFRDSSLVELNVLLSL